MKYDHILEQTVLLPESTPVFVCRADPGEGKTHMARMRLIDIATRDHHVTVGVYAAPTLRLILQTMDDILTSNPKLHPKMHLVCSDSIEREDLQKLIDKSPNSKGLREIIDRVPTEMAVTDQFEFLLTGCDSEIVGNHIEAVSVGNLIFITHECIARLPEAFSGRERCSLFFDEARQCLHANMSMQVPEQVIEYLLKDHGEHGPFIESLDPVHSKSYRLWRWNNATYRDKARQNQIVPLTLDTIAEQWPTSKGTKGLHDAAKRVLNLVNHIKSKMLDVYVATSESNARTSVNVLMAPNRLFYRWGRVLILAADFDKSQMYHLLMAKQNNPRLRKHFRQGNEWRSEVLPHERVQVYDVTADLLDKTRVKKMNARKRKITIAYLMDYDDNDNGSISSRHVNMGLVFREKDLRAMQKAGVDVHSLYRSSLGTLKEAGKLASKYKPYDLAFDRVSSEFQRVVREYNVSKHTSIQYLALRAAEVSEAWLKQNGLKRKSCLMTFNSSSNAKADDGKERKSSPQVKVHKLMSLLNSEGMKRAVFATPQCQGINAYRNYHTAFFCAPLKLTPQQAKLFEDEIANYNTHMDRTADMLKQFAFRINMRDADSKDPTLVIVPDRCTAEYLNNNFLGELATVRAATDILPFDPFLVVGFDMNDPEKMRKKAAKQRTTKRYQDYQKDYKKNVVSSLYNSLTTRISRLRKKVREGTATPHDERELVQAVEARAEEKRRCDEQKRTSKT